MELFLECIYGVAAEPDCYCFYLEQFGETEAQSGHVTDFSSPWEDSGFTLRPRWLCGLGLQRCAVLLPPFLLLS